MEVCASARVRWRPRTPKTHRPGGRIRRVGRCRPRACAGSGHGAVEKLATTSVFWLTVTAQTPPLTVVQPLQPTNV